MFIQNDLSTDSHVISILDFLFQISCFCIFQTSQFPIDNRLSSLITSTANHEKVEAFYYPPLNHHEEMIKPSASSYYTSDDDDYYNDYGTETRAPSPDNFESERIINKKPSDIQKISLSHNSNNASSVHETISNNKLNSSQLLHARSSTKSTKTNLNLENSDNKSNKFPKLLFSSPSASVTSNGPSVSFFINE